MTVTYGDTRAAERAGETPRALHGRMKAIDVETGEPYAADEPNLLRWVLCTIPRAALRACDRWGPAWSAAEKDQ